jgi:taurine dioxygenase
MTGLDARSDRVHNPQHQRRNEFWKGGRAMQEVLTGIQVTPLSAACGAEIRGVDLSRELDQPTVDAIKQAWNDNLVIVFRGQSLTQEQQLRFASRFGPLGERRPPPKAIASRTEGVLQTDNRVLLVSNIKVDGQPIGAFGDADMWFHIDGGYSERPYQYSLLYSVELPSSGGNTLFSNMYKAYDAVPAPLKQRLTAKKALHIHEYKRAEKLAIKEDLSGSPHFFHPVFVTHPNTGRKTLFIDRLMTQRIEGVSLPESDEILEQLYEIGERPEFVYEHVWKLGDLVCWDNRCTIHARTPFPKGENRLMRRCTVEGPPIRE